jgi:hypothetical protein
MSLLQNSNAISSGGYDLTNSLRFRSSASAYLSRTFPSAGSRTTWTWSGWVKRGGLQPSGYMTLFAADNSNVITFYNDLIQYENYNGPGADYTYRTSAVYRDPSAWYHIVAVWDSTNATLANRQRLYVNGVLAPNQGVGNSVPLNATSVINSAAVHNIGRSPNVDQYYDGYLDEVNFVDGQALTPSSFGETDPVTGSWVAKKYTGTYGTNGFYLPFSDTDSNENLSIASQTIGDANWFNANVTVTLNNTAAPNGTTTASRLVATSADSATIIATSGLNSGQTYTWSVYLKADSTTSIAILVDKNGSGTAGYEVLPITVTTSWQRFSVTFVAESPIPTLLIGGGGYFASPEIVYAWGSQLNTGSIAKKYIATTTAVVTNQGTVENLLTYSEDLTNAAWAKANVTATGNTIAAPNGATTADTLFESAITGEHYLDRTLTPTTNTQYVFSTYVKYLNRKYIALRIVYSNGANDTIPVFDIQNGTYYGYQANAPTATSITSVGNGWYRISVTFTTPATNPTASLLFRHAFENDSLFGSYAGSASVGMYVWGSQIETQGTLGPYLPTDASAQSLVHRIGTDRSLGATGFGYNTWIPNNISLTLGTTYDAMTDVPTLTSATVANYAVLNPLNKDTSITVTNGNLAASAAGTNIGVTGSIAISSGKWYWEITQTAGGVATSNIVGITDATLAAKTAGLTTNSYGYGTGTTAYKWNAGTNTAYGSNWTNGDVISVAFDADAGTITFYKNNVSQGTAFTGISGTFYPAFGFQSGSAYAVNFGQRPFTYTPPTGFKRLNTYNLPDSTIKKGSAVMDATLYTGNLTGQSITNAASFKPDLVWIKSRSAATDNKLTDSVRGATKALISSATAAESTDLTGMTAFNTNGFTVGASTTYNNTAATYVGWQWQANQGSTVSNTSGTITSTVSVNTTAGFSVVTYTGTGANATVGHGLGVAPKWIIVKSRTSTVDGWNVYHASLGATRYMELNNSSAGGSSIVVWNNTAPTSSVFSIGTGSGVNTSSGTYVAYCWAEIAGFSKFGSYTGNGSADGTFVYTGFRPKFVMVKRTDTTGNWIIIDAARNTYNEANTKLYPNGTSADDNGANAAEDFLSNGFKLRATWVDMNASGGTFIYMAFAENPFKNSNAR